MKSSMIYAANIFHRNFATSRLKGRDEETYTTERGGWIGAADVVAM